MEEYCAYLRQPEHPVAALETGAPFYANSWSPFNEHLELRGHFSLPHCVPDHLSPAACGASGAEAEAMERVSNNFIKIFFGPAGTVTRLHNDTYYTHAWLSQIRGRKLFVLFPPSQARLIHASDGIRPSGGDCAEQSWFDPLRPDFERFPLARDATPFVAECGEGDTLVVPSLWFHYAVSLTPSITLMRNFFNATNQTSFLEAFQRRRAPTPTPPPRCEVQQQTTPRALAMVPAQAAAANGPPPKVEAQQQLAPRSPAKVPAQAAAAKGKRTGSRATPAVAPTPEAVLTPESAPLADSHVLSPPEQPCALSRKKRQPLSCSRHREARTHWRTAVSTSTPQPTMNLGPTLVQASQRGPKASSLRVVVCN